MNANSNFSDAEKKKIAKFLSVGIVVVFFVGLELISYLFFDSNRLDKILSLLEEDSHLIWKQKKNFKGDFFGTEVITDQLGLRVHSNKTSNNRILVLGASPSFGWGVKNSETYSSLLENSFIGWKVINGSGVGYSSEQGLRFLEKNIENLKPKVVIVSYVINDVDSFRFFQNNGKSDYEISDTSLMRRVLSGVIRSSNFLSLMQGFISSYKKEKGPAKFYLPGKVRVPLLRYQANLKSLINLSKSKGFKLIFLKMPVNLALGPEVINEKEGLSTLSKAMIQKNKELEKFGNCQGSLNLFESAIQRHALLSRAYFELADCYSLKGEKQKSLNLFNKVKEIESFNSSRRSKRYNKLMHSLAEEEQIALVDLVAAFKREKNYLFVDKKSDTIHPNREGHQVIAREIMPILSNILESL